jgi:hypothetical protein
MDADHKSLLDNFTSSLELFEAVFAKIPENGLDWSVKEGEWTVRQVVHHVTEDLTVYGFFIEQALAQSGSKVFFGEFPGNEAWADSLGFDQRPVSNALALMRAQRNYFAELINHFPDRWDNELLFYNHSGEKLSETTVRKMVTMLTDHMVEHFKMIKNILASKAPS